MSWSVPERANLTFERWDEDAIVYNSLSGETHLLNNLACAVLQLLQADPATISTLIGNIFTIFEVEDEAGLEIQIQKLMGEFETLGLIESTQCEN